MQDERLRGISCFAGVAGLDLAIQEDVRTVCYVEWDGYCQEVLQKRMREGWLDDAPIWGDIQSFDGRPWAGRVDIVFGGFPCTDISVAGKRAGIKVGTRSGLWFEMYRIIREVRPRLVFLENVAAITHRGMETVLGCLNEAGYNARWTTVRASDVGAPHRRERWFCLAYDRYGFKNEGGNFRSGGEVRKASCSENSECVTPNLDAEQRNGIHAGKQDIERGITPNNRGKRIQRQQQRPFQRFSDFSWCENVRRVEDLFNRPDIPKPLICRTDDGFSQRVDRLKCLGNAVVPQQGRLAWRILTDGF